MSKYRLLRDRVAHSAASWEVQLRAAPPVTHSQLRRTHDADYVRRVLQGELSEIEVRRIGFPWSPDLVERSLRSAGGTWQAALAALQDGLAVNLAGGTHHAGRDRGQGFCVFNDLAVTIAALRDSGEARQFTVIDCDVHQGNGTAEIFADDEEVFTVSIHGDRNFPFTKCASDLDIALPDGTKDADYLQALREALQVARRHPTDCVLYLAGADPYWGDRLGRLQMTKAGLAQRDLSVLGAYHARGVPVAITMAGGYAANVHDIVDIHATTVEIASRMCRSAMSQNRVE